MRIARPKLLLAGVASLSVLVAACGGAQAPTSTAPPAPTPTPTLAPTETPGPPSATLTPTTPPESTPTATSIPTAAPGGPPATPTATAAITLGPASVTALQWELLSTAGEAPGPRKDATLVYDDAGQRLWLFGGRIQRKETDELWSFDIGQRRWSRVTAPGGPAGRWGHVAVFDDKRGQLVLFSGQSPAGFFNDTWLFDTQTQRWTEATPSGAKPTPRYGSCAGYDPTGDVMYISHGFTGAGRFDDTWAFDLAGARWAELSPQSGRPIKRCLHRCGYDSQSESFYLFGGQSNTVPILGDLWRFDSEAREWTETSSNGEAPSPRFFSALAVDEAEQRLLLFGGLSSQGLAEDLWAFAPTSGWTPLDAGRPSPEARSSHAAALDTRGRALYVFGGAGLSELGDLWRLKL